MTFQHTWKKKHVRPPHLLGQLLLREMPYKSHVATPQFVHQRSAFMFLFGFTLPGEAKFNGRPLRRLADDDIHSLSSLERAGIEHSEVRPSRTAPGGWLKHLDEN